MLARRNGIDLGGLAWKAGAERLTKELDHTIKRSARALSRVASAGLATGFEHWRGPKRRGARGEVATRRQVATAPAPDTLRERAPLSSGINGRVKNCAERYPRLPFRRGADRRRRRNRMMKHDEGVEGYLLPKGPKNVSCAVPARGPVPFSHGQRVA
jgi:hypothetical protein